MSPTTSCWDCGLRQAGGDTFLGLCKIFTRVGGEPKEIPASRVDRGCKHFEPKEKAGEHNDKADGEAG